MYCAWCGAPVATVSYAPCARCGRPTNGAQTAPPASGGSNIVVIIIAVVVGAFFVIAIIGILSAIAIPNLLTAMQRSKQKRTMADIRSIATAVEAYSVDNGNGYPQATSIETLEPMLRPKYIAAMPNNDGWGHPMMYFCYETKDGRCTGYLIGSGGKDGMFEHSNPRDYVDSPPGPKTSFDADLIFANGNFLEYPEGSSR